MPTYYKYCAVPGCFNSSTNNDKIFISVPANPQIRTKWCEAVNYDKNKLPKTCHFCEDHFDLRQDLENYVYWEEFGGKMRFRPDVLPRPVSNGNIGIQLESPDLKRRLFNEIEKTLQSTMADTQSDLAVMAKRPRIDSGNADPLSPFGTDNTDQLIQEDPPESEKNPQLEMEDIYDSFSYSPINSSHDRLSTAKSATQTEVLSLPEPETNVNAQYVIDEIIARDTTTEYAEMNMEHLVQEATGNASSCLSPVTEASKLESDSSFRLSDYILVSPMNCSKSPERKFIITQEDMPKVTKALIEGNPLLYLGINEESLEIVQKIHKKTHIPVQNIHIVLEKIRTNHSYTELAHRYSLSENEIRRIFDETCPKIANVLRKIIIWPSAKSIYRTLPLQFRHQWALVQSIIDCFEIQIAKPSTGSMESVTWSESRHCNTAKYLISITPAGFVNFISQGYGGRASDMLVLENSGYFEMLTEGAEVLADVDFESIDEMLLERGCKLAYTPCIGDESNEIRDYVAHVMERLRNFKMLDVNACINEDMLVHLDNIVIIATALVNMQPPIFEGP